MKSFRRPSTRAPAVHGAGQSRTAPAPSGSGSGRTNRSSFVPQSDWVRRQHTRREEQEFGPGKADFLVCPSCSAVYDDKRWKASFVHVRDAKETKRIAFGLCPACAMIRDGKYEGQILATGISLRRIEEALARIRNVGARARIRDPMDRIIAVRRSGKRIEVTTTENQLALRIGRALKQLLGGKLRIQWSHEEDVVRINWLPHDRR